jgi:nucleoside-diphosphate-sugar epimerase
MARVVAVTGAAGFLGQSLVATLADRDDVAAVLALDTERALDGADFGGSPKGMTLATCAGLRFSRLFSMLGSLVYPTVHKHAFDVRNRAAIASIFRSYGVGAVLHLAGIMSAQSEANLELGYAVQLVSYAAHKCQLLAGAHSGCS